MTPEQAYLIRYMRALAPRELNAVMIGRDEFLYTLIVLVSLTRIFCMPILASLPTTERNTLMFGIGEDWIRALTPSASAAAVYRRTADYILRMLWDLASGASS